MSEKRVRIRFVEPTRSFVRLFLILFFFFFFSCSSFVNYCPVSSVSRILSRSIAVLLRRCCSLARYFPVADTAARGRRDRSLRSVRKRARRFIGATNRTAVVFPARHATGYTETFAALSPLFCKYREKRCVREETEELNGESVVLWLRKSKGWNRRAELLISYDRTKLSCRCSTSY